MKIRNELLTTSEYYKLLKRQEIAEAIEAGKTYDEIRAMFNCSTGTIANIKELLRRSDL